MKSVMAEVLKLTDQIDDLYERLESEDLSDAERQQIQAKIEQLDEATHRLLDQYEEEQQAKKNKLNPRQKANGEDFLKFVLITGVVVYLGSRFLISRLNGTGTIVAGVRG